MIAKQTRKPEGFMQSCSAETESVDLVWYLVCVDLPFIDVT